MAQLLGRLLGAVALTLALPVASTDDAASLIQADVQASQLLKEEAVEGHGRAALLAKYADKAGKPDKRSFDCKHFPGLCEEPFNCQQGPDPYKLSVAKDGHSNLRSWCAAPSYHDYITTCIQKKDLVKAAQIQFDWSVKKVGEGVDEMDGSYCFMEGHCTNTAVTPNTTVEEAEKMCDARYGHRGWANWSPAMEPRAIMSYMLGGANKKTGFHDQKLTRLFLKMACAMGNYHCDVVYCQETYCKKDYYIRKYKHLEPATPGHLIRQRFGAI